MTDRGQSSAIGFVVIFGTILLMVGLVSVSGYSALGDVQDAERVNNGVRSFEVLSTNVDEVVSEGVPSRTTTVKLDGGHVATVDPVTVEVHVPADGYKQTVEVQPLVFDVGTSSQVLYENGAVIRADRDGQVMASNPNMVITSNYAVIPVVRTESVGPTSVGGQSRVSVRTTRNGTTVTSEQTAGQDVYLNVTSERATAWKRYLDQQPQTSCGPVIGNTVSCTLQTKEVTVSVTTVDVLLSN